MVKVGDKIRIISMNGEPQYNGKEGIVTKISIDAWGDTQILGTWGGCAIYPFQDDFIVIE